MELGNRSAQTAPTAGTPAPHHVPAAAPRPSASNKKDKSFWRRVADMGGIIAVVILLLGIIGLLYSNNNDVKDTESQYIYSNKLQAVFLNTGQVYFGNITELNNNFLVLEHIFYLQTSSSSTSSSTSSSNSNVSLVKLGCELHEPYDQMIINRAQVTFWENLQAGGQVAKAVATWNSEHPNGQQCSDQSSASSTTSGSSVQNAGSSSKP